MSPFLDLKCSISFLFNKSSTHHYSLSLARTSISKYTEAYNFHFVIFSFNNILLVYLQNSAIQKKAELDNHCSMYCPSHDNTYHTKSSLGPHTECDSEAWRLVSSDSRSSPVLVKVLRTMSQAWLLAHITCLQSVSSAVSGGSYSSPFPVILPPTLFVLYGTLFSDSLDSIYFSQKLPAMRKICNKPVWRVGVTCFHHKISKEALFTGYLLKIVCPQKFLTVTLSAFKFVSVEKQTFRRY